MSSYQTKTTEITGYTVLQKTQYIFINSITWKMQVKSGDLYVVKMQYASFRAPCSSLDANINPKFNLMRDDY